jgi:GTPase KRas protein
VKQCLIDNQIAQLEILDSAGQEEFKPMREQYIRTGEGFLLVFSLTDRHSLEECCKLHRDILRIKDSDHVPMLLVGNKFDIRQMDLDIQARNVAIAMRIPYFETSARTRYNIDEVFVELVRLIRKNKCQYPTLNESSLRKPMRTFSCYPCSIL